MAERITAGGAIFARLKALGVEVVFCNSGTDFPPIIEGLAEAKALGIDLPLAITVPHEHAAMSMAHGYHQISGKCPAVMLHTNVGLANGVIGAINAACAHVPMLLMSGRTPVTEHSRFGARTVPIAWGQEMQDQAGMVRDCCKWEYELRYPEQIGDLLDRAFAIANTTPKGPAYLSLPREVLCEEIDAGGLAGRPAMAASRVVPDPASLAAAANALAGARAPLVIAQRGVGSAKAFDAFREFVEAWALPVSTYWAVELPMPAEHAHHVGPDPTGWMADADVILVIDSLAPWQPDAHALPDDATVIHLGPDPIFSRFPVRNFRADLALQGETTDALSALMTAMADMTRDEAVVKDRRARIAEASEQWRSSLRERGDFGSGGLTKAAVSRCLGEAIRDRTATVYSELGVHPGYLGGGDRHRFFQEPHSGGLGWGLPAALGAQLAAPERLVFATMGDGSYMFSNPTACHQIAEALSLPVITMVLNNGEWGAVRQSVVGLYPDGHAARANEVPLTGLAPSPDFTMTARASRAHAERVTAPDELAPAIDRAINIATNERRQVLLDILISGT